MKIFIDILYYHSQHNCYVYVVNPIFNCYENMFLNVYPKQHKLIKLWTYH